MTQTLWLIDTDNNLRNCNHIYVLFSYWCLTLTRVNYQRWLQFEVVEGSWLHIPTTKPSLRSPFNDDQTFCILSLINWIWKATLNVSRWSSSNGSNWLNAFDYMDLHQFFKTNPVIINSYHCWSKNLLNLFPYWNYTSSEWNIWKRNLKSWCIYLKVNIRY